MGGILDGNDFELLNVFHRLPATQVWQEHVVVSVVLLLESLNLPWVRVDGNAPILHHVQVLDAQTAFELVRI